MVQRTRLLECPSCHKRLEDTKQLNVTCKFCGHNFRREDVAQEDEDYIRRKMIIDLRTDMEIFKSRKKFTTGFMIACLVMILPLLFAAPYNLITIAVLVAFLVGGAVFFGLMILWDKKYESAKSRASDISMRRRL